MRSRRARSNSMQIGCELRELTDRSRAPPPQRSASGSSLVYEQAAFGHDNFARLQALQHLDHAAARDARLDLAQLDGLVAARHPDPRILGFVDDRIARHAERA